MPASAFPASVQAAAPAPVRPGWHAATRCAEIAPTHHNKNRGWVLRQIRTWRKQLSAALEWHAVDKGLLLMAMVIPLYLQYLCWSFYVLSRPDRDNLINVDVAKTVMLIEVGLTSVGLVIAALGLLLRRRYPDLLLFQHLTLQYFSLSLVLLGFAIGTLSFPAGLVLLGAPIFGFILLDRLAVWLASIAALVVLVGLTYASVWGWLPYAPVKVMPSDASSNLFWINSELFFAAPFLLLITVMADQLLAWWREREERIRQLSRTDALTGLHNRRSIMDLLDQSLARAAREQTPLALAILDLDHFKKINDSWGHPTGDRVLQVAARTLREHLREIDHIGRYGGEEFMVILPGTRTEDAAAVLERCRAALAAAAVRSDDQQPVPVSASFGLTGQAAGVETTPQQLIQRADEALYQAKSMGRNRVEMLLQDSGLVPSSALGARTGPAPVANS